MDSHDERGPIHYHQFLKYSTPSGIANIKVDQAMARKVAVVARKRLGWAQKASR